MKNNNSLTITENIDTDVVVVGGGTAGVFAAICSAMCGARTLLVEKNAVLGGTMTVGGVCFPGLFHAWGKQIIDGPCYRAIERCASLGGADIPDFQYSPDRHWQNQINVDPAILTAVLFEMCQKAGVTVLCNAIVCAAEHLQDGVFVSAAKKGGVVGISAKNVVDCTGDADVGALMGCPLVKSDVQQPASLINHIYGYNINDINKAELFEKAAAFDFPQGIDVKKLFSFLDKGQISLHVPSVNADDSVGLTAVNISAFSSLLRVVEFYKTVGGLEKIRVRLSGCEAGIRETNRIIGKTVITADDYINGKDYPDSVCYAFYPIDFHVMDGIKKTYHKEGTVSKVPYSALVTEDKSRIIFAGRCISSDILANSGLRVEAACMATGQVAGCAAALSVMQGEDFHSLSLDLLKKSLVSIGAIIP